MPTRTPEQQKERSVARPLSFERKALTALFPRVTAITVFLLVVLVSIRGTAGAKAWDQAAFAASLAGSAVLVIRFLRRSESIRPSRFALLISVGGMLFGIARVEHHHFGRLSWEGFGTSVALLSIPIALAVVPVTSWVRQSRARAYVLCAVMLVLAVIDSISLIRDLPDFVNTYDNRFILNEVLAPAAGRVPGATFVPQYTNLFGWFILPFRHLFSAKGLANMSTIVVSCLGICAVALAVVIARRTLPERSWWLALGLTVPLATVTTLHGAVNSSIASSLQELPLRIFPSMLFSLIAIGAMVTLLEQSVPKASLVLLGVLAGLMPWNSQDFGIAVPIAFAIVLQIATRGSIRKRATILWLCGLVPGLMLYPLWTVSIGHPVQLKDLALTVKSFGDGTGAAPIQIQGPVLFVLPVILGSVALGGCLLWRASGGKRSPSKSHRYAVVTLAFVGSWSTLSLPYYVNESYATGQLQTFLLPLGVCLCALFSLCDTADPNGENGVNPGLRLNRNTLWFLPVTLPVAVGLAAILQTPYPSVTLNALRHPPARHGFLGTVASGEVSVAKAYARSHGGGAVGYFGPNANYLQLSAGVDPRILYDDPGDFLLSADAHKEGCQFLRHHPTPWLVVVPGSEGSTPLGNTICGAYKPVSAPGEPPNRLFKLRDSLG